MKKSCLALGFMVVAAAAVWASFAGRPTVGHWQYVSAPYFLKQVFPSMRGPGEVLRDISLGEDPDQLLWLSGYQAIMVDETGQTRVNQSFMCHNSLFLDSSLDDYRKMLGTRTYGTPRVFTLAQGAYRIEFPEGFAIPFPARQKLQLQSQVLNLLPEHVGETVRHRIRADFVADVDLAQKPKPLFLLEATNRVPVFDPTGRASNLPAAATGRSRTMADGSVTAGHWVVEPGEERVSVTSVSEEMGIPFDTTVHYITSHLHPYARWQELRDKTSGDVLYRVSVHPSKDGSALEEIPAYSSIDGLPLRADHDYELATCYQNTSEEPITAMSIIFLYCLDKEFKAFDPSVELKSKKVDSSRDSVDDFCGDGALK